MHTNFIKDLRTVGSFLWRILKCDFDPAIEHLLLHITAMIGVAFGVVLIAVGVCNFIVFLLDGSYAIFSVAVGSICTFAGIMTLLHSIKSWAFVINTYKIERFFDD